MYSMKSEREYSVEPKCVCIQNVIWCHSVLEGDSENAIITSVYGITRVGKRILQEVVGFQDETEFLASRSTSRGPSPSRENLYGLSGPRRLESFWSRRLEVKPNTEGTVWTLKRYQTRRNPRLERIQTGPNPHP